MSQENVEIAQSFFAAFADRDQGAAAKVLHPEVEIRPAVVGGPEGIVYRGLDGNNQFWADVDAAWSEFRIEAEEVRDLGDKVLVLGRAFARAREAASPSMSHRDGFLSSTRGKSFGFGVSAINWKPSKPLGCGSRAVTTLPLVVAAPTRSLITSCRRAPVAPTPFGGRSQPATMKGATALRVLHFPSALPAANPRGNEEG